jgi:hypothetical protein
MHHMRLTPKLLTLEVDLLREVVFRFRLVIVKFIGQNLKKKMPKSTG